MNKTSGLVLPLVAAILVSALTIAFFLSLTPNAWESWRPATCLGAGCFCEAIDTQSPIRQTANTVSSLAFVFSGMFILSSARKGHRWPFGYSYLMAMTCIIIGVGSAFYHASLTFIGQFFDVLGMFLLAAFMLTYAWERIYKLPQHTTLTIYLILNVGLSWLQIAVPDTRRYAFAILLIIALIFEHTFRLKQKPQIEVRWLRLGLSFLAVAYIIWILDNTRIVCFEHSMLQGHALWHILGAVSVVFLHRYYMSEK